MRGRRGADAGGGRRPRARAPRRAWGGPPHPTTRAAAVPAACVPPPPTPQPSPAWSPARAVRRRHTPGPQGQHRGGRVSYAPEDGKQRRGEGVGAPRGGRRSAAARPNTPAAEARRARGGGAPAEQIGVRRNQPTNPSKSGVPGVCPRGSPPPPQRPVQRGGQGGWGCGTPHRARMRAATWPVGWGPIWCL